MEIIKFSDNKKEFIYDVDRNIDLLIVGDMSGDKKIELNIVSENVHVNLYGILVGDGNDEFNLETITNHNAKASSSKVYIKDVLDGNSKLSYSGMIRIDKEGQLTDAYLQNDNLMIGENSVANSSPQLEIQADDVKASHGVTISTIDEYERYYLKSRGINDDIAESILVEGFINDILNKAEDKNEIRSMLKLPYYD